MAEQILHGSNVVTAAEQGRRERVAEGVRCGGLRDACLFYGTFEGALKGLAARAVLVIDENDNVVFSELVNEITTEPDYTAALEALKA